MTRNMYWISEVLDKAVVNLKANKQKYKEEIKPDNEPHKPYF